MDLLIIGVIVSALFVLIYLLSGEDAFAPSVLLSLSYVVAIFCCLYNAHLWGFRLELMTAILIIGMVTVFAVGVSLAKALPMKVNHSERRQIEEIQLKSVVVLSLIGIEILVTYLLYRDIIRIANMSYANWGNLTYNFKTNSNNIEGASISSVTTYGIKLCKAIAFVTMYIFINNCFSSHFHWKSILKNIPYLIPVGIVIYQSLMKGVRIQIISMIFAFLFIYYFFIQIRSNWKWHIKVIFAIRLLILVVAVSVLFYQSKELVGRLQDNVGLLNYVTTYLGGCIALLNLFVRDGVVEGDHSVETMGGFISSIQKLGLFKKAEIHEVREYRNSDTGFPLGNVYGAIRDYYHDFGFWGAMLMTFIVAFVIGLIYHIIRRRGNYNLVDPSLVIVYATLVYAIFFLTFSDFLTAKLSLGAIIEIIFTVVCSKLLITNREKHHLS